MTKKTLTLLISLGALTGSMLAASPAQADIYSCTFNGSISPATPGASAYSFDNAGSQLPSMCLTVDTVNTTPNDTGLYDARISGTGTLVDTVCGTGTAMSDLTTIDLSPIVALGPGEDIPDLSYRFDFAANQGPFNVTAATNINGESGTGEGWASIVPVNGNCITTEVQQYHVAGSFVLNLN